MYPCGVAPDPLDTVAVEPDDFDRDIVATPPALMKLELAPVVAYAVAVTDPVPLTDEFAIASVNAGLYTVAFKLYWLLLIVWIR